MELKRNTKSGSIYILYDRTRFKTGESTKYWCEKKQEVTSLDFGFTAKNEFLLSEIGRLLDIKRSFRIKTGRAPSGKELKGLLAKTSVTIDVAKKEYLDQCRGKGLSISTWTRYKRVLKFVDSIDVPTDVVEIKVRSEVSNNNSIIKYLNEVCLFLEWCKNKGYRSDQVNSTTTKKQAAEKARFFTKEEVSLLSENATTPLEHFFCFLLMSGQRKSDAMRIRKSWIRTFGDREAVVIPMSQKTKNKSVIPLCDRMKKHLNGFLLAHNLNLNYPNKGIKIFVKRLGIDRCENASTKSGRVTFISQSLMDGVPNKRIMLQAGISSLNTLNEYFNMADEMIMVTAAPVGMKPTGHVAMST